MAPDGTISTIFRVPDVHGTRLGDFAGRFSETLEAMDATREGGIVVILAGVHLRAVHLAPSHTRRTLMAVRDVRASRRGVSATVDTSSSGRLELQVRRGGRVVARAARGVGPGRHVVGVAGPFAAAEHDLRATFGGSRDDIGVFTGATLPARLVLPTIGPDYVRACRRIDRRRIDCEVHDPEQEEGGVPCLSTSAYRLFGSGLLFTRSYGAPCHRTPIPFDRSPAWTGLWRAWPPR